MTGQPLSNLVLRADMERLKKIEQFVIKNKLQKHPDRVEPPNSGDIEKQQTDISAQAARWLIEVTPGKAGSSGNDNTLEDMAQYKTLSAKRRRDEVAAGADIVLCVRAARDLADMLRRLDCVDGQDTLAIAIGNAIDYLSSECVNACFYICKERNRVVHEVDSGDELRDVQAFRSAIRKARNGIQDQIDAQNVIKMEQYNLGVELFYKGKHNLAISTLTDYISGLDINYDDEQWKKSRGYMTKSMMRKKLLLNADTAFKRLKFDGGNIKGEEKDAITAVTSYKEVAKDVDIKEECFSLVMTRLALLTKRAKPESCIEYSTKALEKDPQNLLALRSRARAYMKLEDYKSAKADLEQIVQSGKTLVGVMNDLKICEQKTDPHLKLGHLKEDELDDLMAQFGLED